MLISAPVNQLSYGIVTQNILDNLSNYKLKPLGQFDEQKYSRFVPNLINYLDKLDLTQPSLKIFHENLLFDHIGKGTRIGFPIFERNRFTPEHIWNLSHQDIVLVCSKWAKELVEPINPNVIVCPLGVDKDFFPGYIPNQEEKVIFYTQGKREVRKGHNYLHKVFHKAFSEYNDVELWMFTHNFFDNPEVTRSFQLEYKELLGNKVKFFPWLPKSEMINWLHKTDCGIFLSRAEGWNMPLSESLAIGKQVIATYYSGHTEYLKDGIKPTEFELAIDNKWFNGEFTWMKIESNEEEIVNLLREKYEYCKDNRGPDINSVNLVKNFTWQKTAEIINGLR